MRINKKKMIIDLKEPGKAAEGKADNVFDCELCICYIWLSKFVERKIVKFS